MFPPTGATAEGNTSLFCGLSGPRKEERRMNAATARTRPLWALFALAIGLAVVPYAAPASTPLLQLGPITVADGTAVLAGTVGSQAAGSTLTVNGQPLGVDASGAFAGTVDLNGAGSI